MSRPASLGRSGVGVGPLLYFFSRVDQKFPVVWPIFVDITSKYLLDVAGVNRQVFRCRALLGVLRDRRSDVFPRFPGAQGGDPVANQGPWSGWLFPPYSLFSFYQVE